MDEATTAAVDIMVGEFNTDPYRAYARLRREAPVCRVRDFMGIESWLIGRYEEARDALADRRLAKDALNGSDAYRTMAGGADSPLSRNLLSTDPPDHTRLRGLISRAFTPRRIEERLRPRVQEITDELLDRVASETEVDLVEALAFPLPVTVICELLGVPVADREQFRAWSQTINSTGSEDVRLAASLALAGYFSDLVGERRTTVRADLPEDEQPDLVSVLIAARDGGDALNDVELIGTLMLLLIAGHETTVHLIANGMLALFQHPDQLRLLRERPELWPAAVEELLRYTNPAQRATFRYATEDVEIGGVAVPRGGLVSVAIASCNRDEGRFADPDRVDVLREDNHHLAFGHGIHFCLGAPLARQEGRIAFATLLRRFPDIALAVPPEQVPWRFSGLLNGPASLPVRLRPEGPTQ
jgi:cytochrome P450